MKKLILITSMILSLGTIALPSFAGNMGLVGTKPSLGTRLAYITVSGSFVFCHYEYYDLKTGQSAGMEYYTIYSKMSFKGCPAR